MLKLTIIFSFILFGCSHSNFKKKSSKRATASLDSYILADCKHPHGASLTLKQDNEGNIFYMFQGDSYKSKEVLVIPTKHRRKSTLWLWDEKIKSSVFYSFEDETLFFHTPGRSLAFHGAKYQLMCEILKVDELEQILSEAMKGF